jgi:hypothetical protein
MPAVHCSRLALLHRLVAEHRQALESSIFDKGTRGLADTMCVSLFQLCNQHHLVDSGEL